jgi:hypothetical protein
VEPWRWGAQAVAMRLCLWPAIGFVAEIGGRERERRPAAEPRKARRRRRRRRGVEASTASPSSRQAAAMAPPRPSLCLSGLCSLSLLFMCGGAVGRRWESIDSRENLEEELIS